MAPVVGATAMVVTRAAVVVRERANMVEATPGEGVWVRPKVYTRGRATQQRRNSPVVKVVRVLSSRLNEQRENRCN